MKTRYLAPAAALLLAIGGTRLGKAQTEAKATTKEIMKVKLEYAHYLLNGVTTENFPLIATNADKLSQLTQLSTWSGRRTPEYEALSAEFRKHADELGRAAKERNLDAASLAYVQLTLSCINCHKYMRGGRKTGEL